MKKLSALLTALVLSVSLAGCAADGTATNTPLESNALSQAELSETGDGNTEATVSEITSVITEIELPIKTIEDINPYEFVYPDDPLTPENLNYIVNGALEKHMSEEIVEKSPAICEIILVDIDFDEFPEMVFKHTMDERKYNNNKVYSLNKENFAEFLLEFEGWGRDVDTRFFAKENNGEKRFIISSSVSYLFYGYSTISEIVKSSSGLSLIDIYEDSWESPTDMVGAKSTYSTINGISIPFDEYKRDLDKFNATLTELPFAETKIEYNYMRSNDQLIPYLSYGIDSLGLYVIYDEYLKK